jgi:hypothetical protein
VAKRRNLLGYRARYLLERRFGIVRVLAIGVFEDISFERCLGARDPCGSLMRVLAQGAARKHPNGEALNSRSGHISEAHPAP